MQRAVVSAGLVCVVERGLAAADAVDMYPPTARLGNRIYKMCLELFSRAVVVLAQISSDKHQVTLEAPVENFK